MTSFLQTRIRDLRLIMDTLTYDDSRDIEPVPISPHVERIIDATSLAAAPQPTRRTTAIVSSNTAKTNGDKYLSHNHLGI